MNAKEILENKKVGFFFGAGISLPSKVPNLGFCNNIIDLMQCPHFHSKFFNLGTENEREVYRYVIECAIRVSEKKLNCRYANIPETYGGFYEDVIDILEQNSIFDENWKVHSIDTELHEEIEKIESKYPNYWNRKQTQDIKSKIADICKHTVFYMKKIFFSLIYTPEDFNVKGYDLIRDFHNIKKEFSIYSLNNDLLMETFLHSNDIKWTDGFNEKGIYDGKFDGDVKYFKIHGSISDSRCGYEKKRFKSHSELCNRLRDVNFPPDILMGTVVKDSYYGQRFRERLEEFKQNLESCDILFISGFGFNDITIAGILNEWLSNGDKKRLIIRMYTPEGFNREQMKSFYEESLRDSSLLKPVEEEPFKFSNGVIDINKFMQETTLDDLNVVFNNEDVKAYLGL